MKVKELQKLLNKKEVCKCKCSAKLWKSGKYQDEEFNELKKYLEGKEDGVEVYFSEFNEFYNKINKRHINIDRNTIVGDFFAQWLENEISDDNIRALELYENKLYNLQLSSSELIENLRIEERAQIRTRLLDI